jgi:hypothetical protein
MENKLEDRSTIKTQTLVPDPGGEEEEEEEEEVKVINMLIGVTEGGWEYGADRGHGELIVQSLEL